MAKKPRDGGGYNSRSFGDGLAAANKVERETDKRDRPLIRSSYEGGSSRLENPVHDGTDGYGTATSGRPSSTGGHIHKKFNFGNHQYGRGHQSHHSGERKKY